MCGVLALCRVFSRMSPSHKVALMKQLQALGGTVGLVCPQTQGGGGTLRQVCALQVHHRHRTARLAAAREKATTTSCKGYTMPP